MCFAQLFTKVIYNTNGFTYIFACLYEVRHNGLRFAATLFQLKAGLDYVFKRLIFRTAGFGQIFATFSSSSFSVDEGNVRFATGSFNGPKVGQGLFKLFLQCQHF